MEHTLPKSERKTDSRNESEYRARRFKSIIPDVEFASNHWCQCWTMLVVRLMLFNGVHQLRTFSVGKKSRK